MRLYGYILILIAIGTFTGCKEGDREMIIDGFMSNYVDSIKSFDKECLVVLEESFIKYGVWQENTILIEGAEIFPKQKNNLDYYQEDKFLSLLYEFNGDLICETYLYNDYSNDFTPIHMEETLLIKDSLFLVRLYFEDNSLKCGNSFFKGSDTSSLKKNGMFKKQVNN